MPAIKKLILLTGNFGITDLIAKEMASLGAAKRESLYEPVFEVLAGLFKVPVERFTDSDLGSKPFPQGTKADATAPNLKRFASRLGMKPLPVSFVHGPFETPNDATYYYFNKVAHKRWGDGWAAKRFFSDFAYVKSGVYVMSDATQEDLDELYAADLRNTLITVEISDNDGPNTLFDLSERNGLHLRMRCSNEQSVNTITFALLNQIKELLEEPKNVKKTKTKKEVLSGTNGK